MLRIRRVFLVLSTITIYTTEATGWTQHYKPYLQLLVKLTTRLISYISMFLSKHEIACRESASCKRLLTPLTLELQRMAIYKKELSVLKVKIQLSPEPSSKLTYLYLLAKQWSFRLSG